MESCNIHFRLYKNDKIFLKRLYLILRVSEGTRYSFCAIDPDSDSLYDTSSSTKLVQDRRLRIEISAMCENEEIKLLWVNSKNQLSDVLTKKGASSKNLMKTLQSGRIHQVMFSQKSISI